MLCTYACDGVWQAWNQQKPPETFLQCKMTSNSQVCAACIGCGEWQIRWGRNICKEIPLGVTKTTPSTDEYNYIVLAHGDCVSATEVFTPKSLKVNLVFHDERTLATYI